MRATRRGFTGRFAAELLIVFVGVTAAFFVENLRESWSAQRRAEQVVAVLHTDLTDYVSTTQSFLSTMDGGLSEWRDQRALGKRPVPYVFRIRGSESPPITMWQASIGSGVADLLDPSLVWRVGYFYSEIGSSAEFVGESG
jgi:hypothetical protein